ncbi:hypothetical protein [Clostridium sp. Marseille-Q2269]|uniref:hypothetical protein n=1 Tax=Clostridium sp. Marseille-Q2269 TaxID=2942205 RepID=UPI002073F3A7|nr:hypothetical protein [Clostridium sp. Marseille-Q2269]
MEYNNNAEGNKVYIVGGLRTPIGKTNGDLKDILPEKLVGYLIKNIIKKYNIKGNM